MRLRAIADVARQLDQVKVPCGMRLVLVLEDQEQMEADYEYGCEIIRQLGYVPPAEEVERVHLARIEAYEIMAESDLVA